MDLLSRHAAVLAAVATSPWPLPGRRFHHVHGLHRTWPPAHRLGLGMSSAVAASAYMQYARCDSAESQARCSQSKVSKAAIWFWRKRKKRLPLSSTWMDSRESLVQKFHHVCPCQLTWRLRAVCIVWYIWSLSPGNVTFDNSVIPATLRPRSAPVTQLATFTSWWSGLILPANKPS
jgi:hypothetical protein